MNRKVILATVFFTGAAVLVIEVTATRILAPYFGNTLYTVSSIIAVILGALSIGYYFGGILADKNPDYRRFFYIIIVAAIFCLLIQLFSVSILKDLGYVLNIKWGPLIVSMIIFFIPSALLGMLSPYAVKLISHDLATAGRDSGMIFFLSTLGSITGSLITGFYLIPNYGVSAIIIATALFLFIIGAIGIFLFRISSTEKSFLKMEIAILCGILGIMIGMMMLIFATSKRDDSTIFQKDGLYGRIRITTQEINNRPALNLYIDRTREGAVYTDSYELPVRYANYYSLYQLINPEMKTALFLGGGLYSMPRALLMDSQDIENVDVAEIDPELYILARKYFNLVEDRRLTNNVGDGRRFLIETNNKYEMIFADVYYSLYSIPVHFTTREFFQLAKSKLADNGFFAMNVIGSLDENKNDFLLSEFKTFQSVFKNSYIFSDSPKGKGIQNFIFLGIKDEGYNLDLIAGHSRLPIIGDLADKIINPADLPLNTAIILTDDYSPVEKLTADTF
ncbi:MAG: fused MFS/spermidine synthase [bacterium]